MALQREFFCALSLRGYHAYFKETAVCIGDILFCEKEEDNIHDEYAIVVKTGDGSVVGHVPLELSELFHGFLEENGEIWAEVIGCKINKGMGKGLEVPVDYQFVGNREGFLKIRRNLVILKKLLKPRNAAGKGLKLDITKIRPSHAPIALDQFL